MSYKIPAAKRAKVRLQEHAGVYRDRLSRAWYSLQQSKLSLAGLVIVSSVIVVALFAPYIAPNPTDAGQNTHFTQRFEEPSASHLFGTDSAGRDIFSRVLFGARISLYLGLFVISLSATVGVVLGLVAGYSGGWVNTLIMRLTDIFLSVPPLVLALAVAAVLQPTLTNAMLAITLAWWPWYTRLIQGEVLSIKEEEFVEVSESTGAGSVRVIFQEILPNVISPITVKATLDMGFVILLGVTLGFLGVGAQPPTPAWGTMTSYGRQYLPQSWWVSVFPALAIFYTVLGFNLLGDGLRDVLDVEVK